MRVTGAGTWAPGDFSEIARVGEGSPSPRPGFLITRDWEVLELPAGVLSPSELLEASGAPVRSPGYKEAIAKSFLASEVFKCPGWAIVGKCENGHKFAKELLCGREWCPVCGAPWSGSHQRRFARWLPKAQQLETMGQWVIEFPIASRHKYRDKGSLSWAGRRVTAVLSGEYLVKRSRADGETMSKAKREAIKREWFPRGLRRWHWFGDKPAKDGRMRYNPHLNVITEGAYIGKRRLKAIKDLLREALGEPKLIVNYSFATEAVRMVHILKYITRATFRDRAWDEQMSHELFNFRNTWTWGKWDDDPVWGGESTPVEGLDAAAVASLENGACPVCGLALDWTRPREVREAVIARVRDKLSERKIEGKGVRGHFLSRFGLVVAPIAERLRIVAEVKARSPTQADVRDIDCLDLANARALGAGYWRLPDENEGGEYARGILRAAQHLGAERPHEGHA